MSIPKNILIGNETLLEYFLHYLLPSIVSASVVIICFWLGVSLEKRRQQKKRKNELRTYKEKIVMELWEICLFTNHNKKSIFKKKEDWQTIAKTLPKNFLYTMSLDFYDIAKDNNFFDFEFNLKADFFALKAMIIPTNSLIQQYNTVTGEYSNVDEIFNKLSSLEEQILKSSDFIMESYSKISTNKHLLLSTIEGLEIKEKIEAKLKEIDEARNDKK